MRFSELQEGQLFRFTAESFFPPMVFVKRTATSCEPLWNHFVCGDNEKARAVHTYQAQPGDPVTDATQRLAMTFSELQPHELFTLPESVLPRVVYAKHDSSTALGNHMPGGMKLYPIQPDTKIRQFQR